MRDLTSFYEDVAASHGRETSNAVKELYSIYTDGIYIWLAGLWDGEIGGIYYSNSARDNDGFLPDIESTAQAIGNLEVNGIISSEKALPERMQKKIISFLQGLQDESNGYFYHPQWKELMLSDPMRYTSRRARDLHNATGLLNALGASPLYPTAIERINSAKNTAESEMAIPEHLRSKEAFIKYLDSLGINKDSYSVGHRIGAQVAEIRAAGLEDICYDFLCSTQFDNGLWQPELSYRSSNGLMKISCAFRSLKKPMPNMLKSFDAALQIAMDTTLSMSDGITCVYNPPFTIINLFDTMKELGEHENLELCRKRMLDVAPALILATRDKVAVYAEPDGSFSYCQGYPAITSQGVPVCIPRLPESDVNANSLAGGSRTRLLRALGITPAPLFDEKDAKRFFELCGE